MADKALVGLLINRLIPEGEDHKTLGGAEGADVVGR